MTQATSPSATKNPWGLTVLHAPVGNCRADVVFIHGLGGASQTTWSKGRDLDLFWPKTFLSAEKDISSARIMSFGYNAGLFNGRTSVSIIDFANDLLFHLKNSTGDDGDALRIGDVRLASGNRNLTNADMVKVPLVFVAHSMGGLVVKEVGRILSYRRFLRCN